MTPRLVSLVVAVVAAYTLLWLLGQGPLEQVYTAEWTSGRIIWFYAPATLALAIVSRRVLPSALSILGLILGVVRRARRGPRLRCRGRSSGT